MSLFQRAKISEIKNLISDEILRSQLIDLHLGKLTEEQIKQIREEKEREAHWILENFPKEYEVNETVFESKTIIAPHNINGKAEHRDN
jgi:hypothetical protein